LSTRRLAPFCVSSVFSCSLPPHARRGFTLLFAPFWNFRNSHFLSCVRLRFYASATFPWVMHPCQPSNRGDVFYPPLSLPGGRLFDHSSTLIPTPTRSICVCTCSLVDSCLVNRSHTVSPSFAIAGMQRCPKTHAFFILRPFFSSGLLCSFFLILEFFTASPLWPLSITPL